MPETQTHRVRETMILIKCEPDSRISYNSSDKCLRWKRKKGGTPFPLPYAVAKFSSSTFECAEFSLASSAMEFSRMRIGS